MRAPYAGGLEISERCRMASWEAMWALAAEASGPGAETKWNAPVR